MRRIAHPGIRERGAISVVVAIVMVCLLGFAALTVDVGVIYAERAQLQNSSDAVALMVAQKCAKSLSDPECSGTWPRPTERVAQLANGNAVDGLNDVKSITLDKSKRTVSVDSGSKESGSAANSVSLYFAKILGVTTAEVAATSHAQWGIPSKGIMILPLAIAECKFNIDPVSGVGAMQTLILDKDPCVNKNIPGGFGWINEAVPDDRCGITMTASNASDAAMWFTSSTGAPPPSPCTANDLSQINDRTVLFPLFDEATGNGSSGKYFVKGFAAFHVTGYNLSNFSWPEKNSIPNKGLRGYFVKFVSLSQALELGSGPDYGSAVVRLSIGAPSS
ncbi:hypothetical protein J2X01_001507 [Arthrobacter ginsengisoli]|uniref:Putative Flp pilus-assembly TadG-like N-terminal domain-containing protein n=1 Tax=Arthrobacter ginsengisoli TaxID=1356565 RepID=A0ABU1UAM6_9MICC|nr:Tad domain-containing protein [Arthrobacter ginsengisoli]MDR7082219.1 hypothetical protein [Arthrobacter ginsengisoli]